MPLVVGSPTPVTTGGADFNANRVSATFTDPDGQDWPLTDISPDLGWFTTPGIAGWGARPYQIVTDPLPRGGDSVRYIRAEPGRLTWPLHVYSDNSHMEFVQRIRALRRAIMMTVHRGVPGTITVMRPDGSGRAIDCFYEEGFGAQGEMWVSANPVLTLFCPDGLWRDLTPVNIPRAYAVSGSYLSPYPTVSSGNVLGASTASNPGDAEAWPDWTITGPASSVTATNSTTGQSWTINFTLLAGQTITVATLRPTVRGPAGENISAALNWPDAYLWPLLAGSNNVAFTVAGAGPGTSINMQFYPRYEGA